MTTMPSEWVKIERIENGYNVHYQEILTLKTRYYESLKDVNEFLHSHYGEELKEGEYENKP